MSKDAVLAFINASESDPNLEEQLRNVKGSDAVVELAGQQGFVFTVAEFRPVVHLIRFLNDVSSDDAVRTAIGDASDDDGVVAIARTLGYEFTADELSLVSFVPTGNTSLSDQELEAVAGGADIDPQVSSGLRVQLQQSRQKTSTGQSFSEIAASGLTDSADAVMSAGQLAAPYIPGGSVLSAAMSG